MTDTTISIADARQQLHEIIRKDVPFEEKAGEALELGRQCLGVDTGFLTRIDQETDHWEVEVTTETADGKIPPGLEVDLQETYCRETIKDDNPNTLHDAPNQGWADDPAFETSERHTYLGTPLILREAPYGTVCFVADDPRSEPFSETETMFAEHLTRLLERELEREHIEAELTSQTNLAAVLNRVLRHNLRNDITVVRGRIQQIAEQLPDEPAIETIFENIDSLINLGERARELEQIVTSDIKRQPTALARLVEDVVETVAEEHPHASLSVEYDENVSAALRPNFERAISELLENAIEHGHEHPTVSVTIDRVPNAVEIQVADDGPGLPDMEAEVLSTGEETPLSHGIGLGLWLTNWIVTSHEGSIDTTVTDNGTTITLSIPRIPDVSPKQQLPDSTRGRDRFQAAFEEAHDTILILNDDAKIVNSNPATETLFGQDWEELMGKSLAELVPEGINLDAEMGVFQDTGAAHGTITVVDADSVEHIVEYSGKANIVPGEHLLVGRDITERKQREKQLEAERRRFQSLVDVLPHAIYRADPDTLEPTYINDVIKEIHGYSSDEWLQNPDLWEQSLHTDDVTAVMEAFQTHLESKEPGQLEYRIQTKDGETRWVQDTFAWENDEAGNVTALVGVYTDITERKEREQQIQRERDRFQSVFEGAFDAMVITNDEGEYIEANESATRLFGCEKEELLGKSIREFAPEDFAFDSAWDGFTQAGSERGTFPLVRRDGSKRTVEYAATRDILPNQHLSILRDITERKERERRYDAIFNQTYQFTGLLDTDGTVLEANETALDFGGFDREDVVGKPFWEADWWPDDATKQELQDAIDRAATGEFVRFEVEVQGDEGTAIIDFSIRPVTDDENTVTLLIPEGRDITERKERERKLKALKVRYETLLAAAPDPVFVADVDTAELIEVNDAAETLVGASSDEIVGLHISELHPSDRSEQYRQLFEDQSKTGGTRRQLPDGSQIYVESFDGEQIPVEIGVETVTLPDGPVIYGIFRDISTRIDREVELRGKTE